MHHTSLSRRYYRCRLWTRSTRTTCRPAVQDTCRVVDGTEYWTNSAPRCAAEPLPCPWRSDNRLPGPIANAAVESPKTHGRPEHSRNSPTWDLVTWRVLTRVTTSSLDSDSSEISFHFWGLLKHRHRLCYDNLLFLQKRAAANAMRRSSARVHGGTACRVPASCRPLECEFGRRICRCNPPEPGTPLRVKRTRYAPPLRLYKE